MYRILVLLLLISAFHVHAQENYMLTVRVLPPAETSLLKNYRYKTQFRDSLSLLSELRRLLADLHDDAYLSATVDTVRFEGRNAVAELAPGQPFRWLELQPGNVDEALLRQVDYREKFFKDKHFRHEEFLKLKKAILIYSENRGYPFARLQLDSIRTRGQYLGARLLYSKGTYIRFDSLTIEGDVNIKPGFLANYLNLVSGQPFSQQRVNEATVLLKSLPYLRLAAPLRLTFENDRAYVTLPLQPVRSSQFDGIVGLLPNVTGSRNRLSVTGQVNIRLNNLFSSGKLFHIEWQQMQRNATLLNAEYEHPNLLRLRFDINFKFNLFRQDTTFINISQRIRLSYLAGDRGRIHLFSQFRSSEVTGNRRSLSDSLQAGTYAFTRYTAYGLGYEWQTLDNVFAPRRGWDIGLEMAAGNKNLRNRARSDTALLGVPSRMLQLTGNFRIGKFTRLGRNTALLLRSTGSWLLSEHLFVNELLRLGGFRTLRGFNENEFYASRYLVNTAEIRLYFEAASYTFLFVDQAWWRNVAHPRYHYDVPVGVGAGISFATKTGIFNFVYALGRSQQQVLAPTQSKIHFGLISRF